MKEINVRIGKNHMITCDVGCQTTFTEEEGTQTTLTIKEEMSNKIRVVEFATDEKFCSFLLECLSQVSSVNSIHENSTAIVALSKSYYGKALNSENVVTTYQENLSKEIHKELRNK
jgi:hypothetical protein